MVISDPLLRSKHNVGAAQWWCFDWLSGTLLGSVPSRPGRRQIFSPLPASRADMCSLQHMADTSWYLAKTCSHWTYCVQTSEAFWAFCLNMFGTHRTNSQTLPQRIGLFTPLTSTFCQTTEYVILVFLVLYSYLALCVLITVIVQAWESIPVRKLCAEAEVEISFSHSE